MNFAGNSCSDVSEAELSDDEAIVDVSSPGKGMGSLNCTVGFGLVISVVGVGRSKVPGNGMGAFPVPVLPSNFASSSGAGGGGKLDVVEVLWLEMLLVSSDEDSGGFLVVSPGT